MKQKAVPRSWILQGLDVHHRFVFASLAAGVAFLLGGKLFLATRFLVSWDAFALTAVVLAWIVLCVEDPYEVRRNAQLQDGNATLLFALIVSAAVVSLLAVGVLLGPAKSLSKVDLAAHVAVSVATIFISWTLVHTLFALRYAHLYYFNAREKAKTHALGGLEFPGGASPDYLDFAYFSFVVGMTCQTSDVGVSASRLRRLTLVHGLISFCFNTAILAMFVNIVASLI